MILRGILQQSLGRYCIRGYAYLRELERVSRADFTYQRNLIRFQKQRILKFLDNNPNLFFPEVILSYVVKYRFPKKGGNIDINPLSEIISGRRFNSNVDKIKFTSKKISFKTYYGSPGIDEVQIVTIDIDDSQLAKFIENNEQPFLRIDGNHRLSAAAEFKERQGITYMMAPFCLILLADENPGTLEEGVQKKLRTANRFEKTVFHNINSKSIPLSDEEIYKVIIDDSGNFTDSTLLNDDDFGIEYLFARKTLENIKPENFPAIHYLLHDKKEEVQNVRTIFVQFFMILKDLKLIDKRFVQYGSIVKILKKVDQLYDDNPQLKQSRASGLLVAFMFFIFKKNKFNLDWFNTWVLDNHMYELKKINPIELIGIFNKIIEASNKTIFIAMPFSETFSNTHHTFFKSIIEEINQEKFGANLKLQPLRIDKYRDGSAYKIPDMILKRIEQAGLMIADLTGMNANVYHEVGYLMGLNKRGATKKLNLLMICKKVSRKDVSKYVGFNINSRRINFFDDTSEIREIVKEEIISHYFRH